MAYEVPASKKSVGQDKFDFTIEGKAFSVDKVKFLNGFQMEDLTSGNLTRIYSVFGERGSKLGDAVRGLEQEQVEDLVKAWIDDSKVTPGESKAS